MTTFVKFNPVAFRSPQLGSAPTKVARPAKAGASDENFSDFSSFGSEFLAPVADQLSDEMAPPPGPLISGAWTMEDWFAFYEKRAGVAEPAGGVVRVEAEARAFAGCVVEWLNGNPAPSPPGRCARCNGVDLHGAIVIPFGTEPENHTWLHAECWPAWRNLHEAEAVAALAELGICKPTTEPQAEGKPRAE